MNYTIALLLVLILPAMALAGLGSDPNTTDNPTPGSQASLTSAPFRCEICGKNVDQSADVGLQLSKAPPPEQPASPSSPAAPKNPPTSK